MAKLKTYLATSVWLTNAPDCHAASNGGKQYTIVVRAANKKRVADLLQGSLSHLNNFSGIHEVDREHHSFSIPQKEDTIYYRAESTKHGFVDGWFVYDPTKRMVEAVPLALPVLVPPPVRIVEERLSDNSVVYNIKVKNDDEEVTFPCVSEKAARWACDYFDKALKIAAGDWENV